MQTRMIIVIGVVAGALLFALGIIIGHFAIEKSTKEEDGKQERLNANCDTTFSEKWKNYRKR